MNESAPNPERLTLDNEFYFKFSAEDQRAMHAGRWPYKDPEWILNKWKERLEETNDSELSPKELENKQNALWLWYHHASQFAYADGDPETALSYIEKALYFREQIQLENDITPLLKLLYQGNIEEAKRFAETIPARVPERQEDGTEAEVDNVERETAAWLIQHFEGQRSKQG